MGSDIRIRNASRADIESIVLWQVAMAKETEDFALDPQTVTRGVTHVFEHPGTGFYLIAEMDRIPCGCMLVLSEWSDWRAGTILWLHSVYIEPLKRRRGIFASMHAHVKNLVTTDPNLRGLRLYVDRSNHNAASVYRKLGMSSDHYELFEWVK